MTLTSTFHGIGILLVRVGMSDWMYEMNLEAKPTLTLIFSFHMHGTLVICLQGLDERKTIEKFSEDYILYSIRKDQ
jgi:hypothetical protein